MTNLWKKMSKSGKKVPIPLSDPLNFNTKKYNYDLSCRKMEASPEFCSILNAPVCISRTMTLDWCACGKCTSDILPRQNACCAEIASAGKQGLGNSAAKRFFEKFENLAFSCISQHELFHSICLNSEVLSIHVEADRLRPNMEQKLGKILNADRNKVMRYYAYRSFVLWAYGHLGYKNRLEVPACVRGKIIAAFPSLDGFYSGFHLADFDD